MNDKKQYEIKDLTGTLFPNSYKKSETDRDHNGTIKIDGVEYWASAWNNMSAAGNPYIKMAFSRKDNAESTYGSKPSYQPQKPSHVKPEPSFDPDNDDIPF